MAQFARPSSDNITGAWTPTPIWSNLDEVVEDDSATEVQVTTSSEFIVNLSAVTDPLSSSGHTIRIRLQDNSFLGDSFTVTLYQGGTPIVGFLTGDGLSAYFTDTYTLAAAEANSITDYSNLRISVVFSDIGGGGANAFVTWIEFEVPAGGPTITTNPSNQYKATGTTASFSVSATGSGGLTYQWQRDNNGDGVFGDIGAATSATYSFTVASTDQHDHFRCKVTDSVGNATSSAAVLTLADTAIYCWNRPDE